MSGFFNFEQDTRTLSEEEDSCLPSMTYKERIYAFCVTFGLGLFIDIISLGSIFGVLTGNPVRYAMSLTVGNVLSIAASGFLLGFKRQIKGAFDPKRRICAGIFVASMIMTFVSVLFLSDYPIIILFFIISQILSYIWYITSYIPWGRTILMKCLKMCFKCCVGES